MAAKNNKIKLTIGLMVKNEEEYLERCLTALQSLRHRVPSELIIADTGSVDRTLGIAEKFADRVYHYPWNQDFAAARNFVWDKAHGEWFLQLDADEIFESTEAIERFFTSGQEKDYNDASFIVRSYVNPMDMTVYNNMNAIRIFRRLPGRAYKGMIHEAMPEVGPSLLLEDFAHHYGYLENNKAGNYAKANRNIPLLEKEIRRYPENTRMLWHLAREYNTVERRNEAEETCRRAIRGSKDSNYGRYAGKSFLTLCEIYTGKGMYEELIRTGKEYEAQGFGLCADRAFIYIHMTNAFMVQEKYEDAVLYFDKFFKLKEELEQQFEMGERKEKAEFSAIDEKKIENILDNYAKCLEKCSRYEEALECLGRIRGADGDNSVLLSYSLWISLLKKTENYGLFYEFFQSMEKEEEVLFAKTLVMRMWEEDRDISRELARCFLEGADVFSCLERILGDLIPEEEEWNATADRLCEELPTEFYYAQFVLNVLEHGGDVSGYIERCSFDRIQQYPGYLYFRSKKIRRMLFEGTMGKAEHPSLKVHLFFTLLNGQVISDVRLREGLFQKRFWENVEHMMAFIRQLYRPEILTEQECTSLPDYYCFICLAYWAGTSRKQGDNIGYMRYLKKAIQVYPPQAKNVKRLLKEVEEELDARKKASLEFQEYAQKVKDLIRDMIRRKNYSGAKEAIGAYEQVNPLDDEIGKLKEMAGIYLS